MTGEDDTAAPADQDEKAGPIPPIETPGFARAQAPGDISAERPLANPDPVVAEPLASDAIAARAPYTAATSESGLTASQASPRPAGRSWPTAVLGAGVILLLAAVVYLFTIRTDPDRLAALDKTVADLKAQVVDVQARPAPADVGPLTARVEAVDKQLAALKESLGSLQARVESMPAQNPAAADVGAQIADMAAKVADLSHGLDATRSALDDGKQQVAATDTRVAALQTKVDAVPTIDLGPLTTRLDSVEARLGPLTAEAEAAKSFQRVTEERQNGTAAETRAAPLAVTSQAVLRAVEAGKPFAQDLKVLRSLGADSAALQPLAAVADAGAPTIADLRGDLARLRDALAQQAAPAPTGSYLDRLMAGAATVVRVRPLGSVVGDSPPAVLARMDEDLAKDDLAATLAEWAKLPEAGRTLGKGLAERIRLRQAAADAARAVGADAIKAMAAAQP